MPRRYVPRRRWVLLLVAAFVVAGCSAGTPSTAVNATPSVPIGPSSAAIPIGSPSPGPTSAVTLPSGAAASTPPWVSASPMVA